MLTAHRLETIKAAYFRVASLRTGIPTRFYELPPEVLAAYEESEAIAGFHTTSKLGGYQTYEQIKADSVQEWPGRFCPRYSRREVGYADERTSF